MGKTKEPKKAKPDDPTEVVVRYDLFDLPTAFHKAGLAGLVMLLDSLGLLDEARCEVTATTVAVTFNEPLVVKLMNDVYDARRVEVAVKSKWKEAEVARPPTDAEKQAGTPFVYRVVQPCGRFLRERYPDEDGLWLKLWRDMLWAVPRGRPKAREPYDQRAEGATCKEGPNAWDNLHKVQKARAKNGFHTAEVSSALWPGAQAVNAEGVAFEGRAEQNLLLHFWPLAVLLFVPRRVEADGSSDFAGYTLAVPEVSDLKRFLRHYPLMLHGLPKDARGYRPAGAVIDLPAEGGLAFLDHLATIAAADVEGRQIGRSLAGVEYLHLVKEGNNVKLMAAGRVAADETLMAGYREIVAPNVAAGQPLYRNPLFRRGLLAALLAGEPWFRPFGKVLAGFDPEVFVRRPRPADAGAEKGPPPFPTDASKKLTDLARRHAAALKEYQDMPEAERAATPRPAAELPVIVNRVVRTYLLEKAADKSGVKLDQFETDDEKIDWKSVPAEFNEAKQKLALGLVLEFRSRKDRAFVDHFAATFFAVTQRIGEADRLALAVALTADDDRRDDLKTLTLLALSANS